MTSTRKLWIILFAVLFGSFAVLLLIGRDIAIKAPPMPERVVTEGGETVYTRADIQRGRQVWQSMGGMQLGSIWGHGGYVAPDWSADWLHRESLALMNRWAGGGYAALDAEAQSGLQDRLRREMRPNTYDADTGTITLSDERAAAIAEVSDHYESLFGTGADTAELRENYAMKNDTVPDPAHREDLSSFFWRAAGAATTQRPDRVDVTYTKNCPSEPLVGNRPPASTFVWSAFSVIFLLAGIALLGVHRAMSHARGEEYCDLPPKDPLREVVITPSMKATAKYFWVLLALFLVQILFGAMSAHYQVEG